MKDLKVTCPNCGITSTLSAKGRPPKVCKSCNTSIERQVSVCLAEREEEMKSIAIAVGKGLASAGIHLSAEDFPYVFSKLTRSYMSIILDSQA